MNKTPAFLTVMQTAPVVSDRISSEDILHGFKKCCISNNLVEVKLIRFENY